MHREDEHVGHRRQHRATQQQDGENRSHAKNVTAGSNSSVAALNNSCACPAVVRPAKPSLRFWWIGPDKSSVTRATALIGGLAALAIALMALGFALWATGDGSVLGGFGRAAVLALAGAAIAAAFGGLTVATRGIASRAWLLHGLSVLLAVLSYGLAFGLAEIA